MRTDRKRPRNIFVQTHIDIEIIKSLELSDENISFASSLVFHTSVLFQRSRYYSVELSHSARSRTTGAASPLRVEYAQSPYWHCGFRGVDSSIILVWRGEILMSTGDFPESLSQAMLVGTMLVGRLGVRAFFYLGFDTLQSRVRRNLKSVGGPWRSS